MLPGFTAEASLSAGGTYAGVGEPRTTDAVVAAVPRCQNCDFCCRVCEAHGLCCGGCAFCLSGICDRSSPDFGGMGIST